MEEEKSKYIENYILDLGRQLERSGIPVPTTELNKLINRYAFSELDIEEIISELTSLATSYKENYIKIKKAREEFKNKSGKEIKDIPLEQQGITLNIQDIDLLSITRANTKEALQEVIEGIKTLREVNFDWDEDLEQLKELVFRTYQDSMLSIEEIQSNPNLELERKIEIFFSSEDVSPETKEKVRKIVEQKASKVDIAKKLEATLTEEELREAYGLIRDLTVVEKEGIKEVSIAEEEKLLERLRNDFTSITLDEVGRYHSIVLSEGIYDFTRLKKALDFAKSLDKKVRLNTLIFYMDFPEEFNDLEITTKNHERVKKALMDYVDATTKFIRDNNYVDTVRSIDVFNELLNRFAMEKEPPYLYRGDITPASEDDNEKAGWLKFLTIEDLCDVIAVARKNLPTTDFMYNDDNLIDPKKWSSTREILRQISNYEDLHHTRLVDSIGTQMHINNLVTGQEVREMFKFLDEFHLPIEITEFDLAMTTNLYFLKDFEIDLLKQAQMNELYEVINKQQNLRGFTIWSKTDKDNFRLTLKNGERKKENMPSIKTLHGGYFTDNYEEKSESIRKKINIQTFNYHTHTNRCGHASIAKDIEYLEMAKRQGITKLGFSDHIPTTSIEIPREKQRMAIDYFDEYVYSIRKLGKENPDMTILCGLEGEYEPYKISFLNELRDKLDYMILGQHYVTKDGKIITPDETYPIAYAESVCEAMESGIYDIVAHPDIFMSERRKIPREKQQTFDENALIAARMICSKAQELQIPLELNLGGEELEKGYPDKTFWSIAKEYQAPVLYGIDAHTPKQIEHYGKTIEKVEQKIDTKELNFVPETYNPKTARKTNGLEERRQQVNESTLSFETYTVKGIITHALKDESDIPPEEKITRRLQELSSKTEEQKEHATRIITEKIDKISNATNISSSEKTFLLGQAKRTLKATKNATTKRQELLANTLTHTLTATKEGCKTNEQYISRITSLTEQKVRGTNSNEQLTSMMPTNNHQPKAVQKTLKRPNSGNISLSGIVIILGILLITISIIITIIS